LRKQLTIGRSFPPSRIGAGPNIEPWVSDLDFGAAGDFGCAVMTYLHDRQMRSDYVLVCACLVLAETNAWAATVVVDEFDAGGFQDPPNGQVIGRRH
jgi:hypothetical protein